MKQPIKPGVWLLRCSKRAKRAGHGTGSASLDQANGPVHSNVSATPARSVGPFLTRVKSNRPKGGDQPQYTWVLDRWKQFGKRTLFILLQIDTNQPPLLHHGPLHGHYVAQKATHALLHASALRGPFFLSRLSIWPNTPI